MKMANLCTFFRKKNWPTIALNGPPVITAYKDVKVDYLPSQKEPSLRLGVPPLRYPV